MMASEWTVAVEFPSPPPIQTSGAEAEEVAVVAPPDDGVSEVEYCVTPKPAIETDPASLVCPPAPRKRRSEHWQKGVIVTKKTIAAYLWITRLRSVVVVALAAAASLVAPSCFSAAKKVSFFKKTVKSHDIVIFSKSYCPYCRRAKTVFKELKKEPYVVDLDQRDDGPEIQDALSEFVGRRTVPQVFIHGKHLGGSDDTVEAYESGKLLTLLGIVSKDDL